MMNHGSCKHPPLSTETTRLVAEYEATKGKWTHEEKALAESLIWDSLSPEIRRAFKDATDSTAPVRRIALVHLLDASTYEVENHDRLLQAGALSKPLWTDVNSGKLKLSGATMLLVGARRLAHKSNISLAEAMERTLAEYRSHPTVMLADGTAIHRRRPRQPRHEHKDPPRVQKADPPVPVREPRPEPEPVEPVSERELWNRVRKDIHRLAAAKLATMPEGIMKEQIIIGMERDVKIMLDDWSNKLNRAKKKALSDATVTRLVSRPTVVSACRTLHMDPPALGKPVDMDLARRQKKRLVTLYHPDSNAGDETTRAQYEAVLAAFQELQDYMEQAFPENRAPKAQ